MLDPLLRLFPSLVQCEQTSLSATFDELIGLSNEFCRENPAWKLGIGRNGTSRRIPGDLRDLRGRIYELCRNLRGGVDGRGALEPVCKNELGVVFTDGWRRIY